MASYLFIQVCLLWDEPAKCQKAYCRIIGKGTGVHFCLRYFKSETSRMRDRPLFVGSKVYFYIICLYHNSHAGLQFLTVTFNVFKETVAWDFTYFICPVYADSYCNSRRCLIFLKGKQNTFLTFY